MLTSADTTLTVSEGAAGSPLFLRNASELRDRECDRRQRSRRNSLAEGENYRCVERLTSAGPRLTMENLDAPRGFEPRLTESESVVLPLDDGATERPR
jgi:hypothetical protein